MSFLDHDEIGVMARHLSQHYQPDGPNISLIAHSVRLQAEDFDPFVICHCNACVVLIEALQ